MPVSYNFAYLDEQSKKMIRRAILKALAIPGFQVPFGGREMPLPYGWGTGGIQLITEALNNNTCVIGVFHDPADHRDYLRSPARPGRLTPGADADIIIVDQSHTWAHITHSLVKGRTVFNTQLHEAVA